MSKVERRQRGAVIRVAEICGIARIGQSRAQAAQRQIRLLRQEQAGRIGGAPHMAAAEQPQPGDGAQQRALAAARTAADQQAVAGSEIQRLHIQQRPAIRQGQRQRTHRQHLAIRIHADLFFGRQGARLGHAVLEAGQAVDHGLPFGDVGIGRDDVAERFLHLAESRYRLHQAAKLDAAAEITRCRHHEGKDHRNLAVTGGEPGQLLGAAHDGIGVVEHRHEAARQPGLFHRFAMLEGDAFGMFAHAHQMETEIGLHLLAVEIQFHQRLADPVRQAGADSGIDDGEPDHVAGNLVFRAAKRDGEIARQAPQDAEEGDQRDHGIHQAERQAERIGREQPQILGDALVRVVGIQAQHLHVVIALVAQPVAQPVFGQPLAPADLQHLLQVVAIDRDDDEGGGNGAEGEQQGLEGIEILLLQRVVEVVVPGIEPHAQAHAGQVQHDDRRQQADRDRPFAAIGEIGAGQKPEGAEESGKTRHDILGDGRRPGRCGRAWKHARGLWRFRVEAGN